MIQEYLSEPIVLAAVGVALIVISLVLRVIVHPYVHHPQN
jgi:hypothetical protein